MKKFLRSIAWNAYVGGRRAAEFENSAHRHSSAFWLYAVATAAIWSYVGWRWALVPEAIALWTAWNAISARFVARYMKKMETRVADYDGKSKQQASLHQIETAPAKQTKGWAQIARERPEDLYAHEQASYILERQHPGWTLRQLRQAYPHILFRKVPKHASEWALWETSANDPTVPEATRQEYRVQLEIRDMLARRRAAKGEVDEKAGD